MEKRFLSTACIFLACAASLRASPAVDAMIARITPGAAAQFTTETLPGGGPERFEIRAENGRIMLRGTSLAAQAAAYGWYLKHVANAHLSWNGNQLSLPARLPAPAEPIKASSPYPIRYAYNYTALSYTAAFWDWPRWERELDFLATSGFNQALVTAGLEKVWRETLRELGYPEDRIRAFIASPAYAAWWHMGNLEGEGGPLSDAQVENEAALGRRIATRMRELGIAPVLAGFVGLLPHDIGDYVPKLDLIPQGEWVGGYQRPIVLRPTSPAFPRIAAIWYKHLHAIYGGPARAYAGDLFHEGGNPGGTPLKEAAQAVQRAMQTASPDSVWVLQAWQANPRAELVSGLDLRRTEILQLARNMRDGDNGTPLRTFNGRPWVWGELANFGGKQGLYGGVPLMASLASHLLAPGKERGRIVGVGLLSEGTEQNPLYYDLFFDNFWRDGNLDLRTWLDGYAHRRYGAENADARRALDLLLESGIYSPPGVREGPTESILCAKPARDVRKASTWSNGEVYYNPVKIADAAQTLLRAGPQLKSQETYRYDLVDWTRQVIAELARPLLADAMAAYDRKDKTEFDRRAAQFLDLIRDSDRLLASDGNFLLGRWIARARAKGFTPAEKARMEVNARTLITTWSGRIDALDDYANRQCAGMMRDYYLPRWQGFFDTCREILEGWTSPGQLEDWYMARRAAADLAFAKQTTTYPVQPSGDTVAIAAELLGKYVPLTHHYADGEKRGAGMKWKLAPGLSELVFDVNEIVTEPGAYRATFQWKEGDSALQIHSVALYEGEKKVAEDVHEGWTGWENRENSYRLALPKLRTNLDTYTVRARVSGASGTDSAGVLLLEKAQP